MRASSRMAEKESKKVEISMKLANLLLTKLLPEMCAYELLDYMIIL
jgi:hypothetical protein|tara:strand:+ start:243 stop:380 length:138 start_codon:yes stop_codon:yes gene_type:complete